MSANPGEITALLGQWADGSRDALDRLTSLVYGELHGIADAYLRNERPGHTLQPTTLVNEAWLRLVGTTDVQFDHRGQFFALAAQVMRRILVDHARRLQAGKRGGRAPQVALDHAPGVMDPTEDLVALDQALTRLAAVSPRQAQIVELRYFAGLGVEDVGRLLGVSPATVSREQKSAEAWLSVTLGGGLR